MSTKQVDAVQAHPELQYKWKIIRRVNVVLNLTWSREGPSSKDPHTDVPCE